MKLVLLEWDDSATPRVGWLRADELPDHILRPLRIRSVGWVVHEDERAVVLAGSRCVEEGQEQMNQLITIPKAAIVRRRRIKEP